MRRRRVTSLFPWPRGGIALAVSFFPVVAAAQDAREAARPAADTSSGAAVAAAGPLFGRHDALVIAAFAAGATVAYHNDRGLARAFRHPSLLDNAALHNTAALFRTVGQPGVLLGGIAAYGIGRAARRPAIAAAGLRATEAIAVTGLLTSAGKLVAGRARPFLSDGRTPDDFALWRGRKEGYTSMPSGHTSAAFAAASALAVEWRASAPQSARVAIPLLYAGATLVGASRLYHNRHWASDVVAGAALGTVTGGVVARLARAHPRNPIDRRLLGWRVVPTFDGARIGLALAP